MYLYTYTHTGIFKIYLENTISLGAEGVLSKKEISSLRRRVLEKP